MARAPAKSVKKPTAAKPRKNYRLRARVRGSSLELLEPKPIALREGDEVTVTVSERPWKPNLEALHRSFGSWEGLVDTDALLKDIQASRRIKNRRPVPRFQFVPFLVDTDWVIDALRGRSETVTRLKNYEVDGLSISIISLAEEYEGVFYSNDPTKAEVGLNDFMQGVLVRQIDDKVARIFARQRGRLRKLHQLFGDMDLLIGATAIRHNLTLLSNNRRDFERIENLSIVSLQNYRAIVRALPSQ